MKLDIGDFGVLQRQGLALMKSTPGLGRNIKLGNTCRVRINLQSKSSLCQLELAQRKVISR